MKSQYLSFVLFLTCICLLTTSKTVDASHIYGAEISYQCVDPSADQYFVRLKLYSECAAVPLPTASNVSISSAGCAVSSNETLPLLSSFESSPYCTGNLSNTICNGGSLPGFYGGIYGKLVTLSGSCSDWVIQHSQCCRNGAITNLVNPSFNDIYVKSELDASAAVCNSSPAWNQPAVLFCGTGFASVELGGTDPDGDSLVFSLVNPMSSGGVPIAHNIGYSAGTPISSSTALTFDSETGTMTFTPNISQGSAIAVKVEEYRNGNLIASSYRDIQLTIATGASCTNANYPPQLVSGPTNVTGGMLNNGILEACAGTAFSFNLALAGAVPASLVDATSNASSLGGTFGNTFTGYTFAWTPSVSDTGVHVLSVVARGDCALPGISVFNFVINVTNCTVTGPVDAGPDQFICAGSSVQLQATGGVNYQWSPATGLSSTTIANPVASPATTTMYYVSSVNQGMVLSTDSVLVTVQNATVDINVLSGSTNLCLDDTIVLDAAVTGAGFAGYAWSTGETTSSITIHTFNPISFSNVVSVTVTDNVGCTASDTIVLNLQDECVWPGDADYDGIANNFDILNIGIGSGTTGPSRMGATINWESQWSADWVDTFATGNNYKHGDCNGDGLIDDNDTTAVSQNYGLTHAKGNASNGNGLVDPALYFTFSNDSVNAGDTLTIFANLGRDTLPAVNIYGIAFTVNYDAALVDTGSVSTDFSNSWIDIPMDGLLSFTRKFESMGMIDVAITRTDQTNANSNFGPIGAISVVMKDDISGKDMISKAFDLSYAKVKAVSSDGTEVSVFKEDGGAIVSQEIVGISSPFTSQVQLDLFPNPSSGLFHIYATDHRILSVEIYNLIGELIYEDLSVSEQRVVLDLEIENGIYMIKVETDQGFVLKKITIAD